jgi:hypothetical protein
VCADLAREQSSGIGSSGSGEVCALVMRSIDGRLGLEPAKVSVLKTSNCETAITIGNIPLHCVLMQVNRYEMKMSLYYRPERITSTTI